MADKNDNSVTLTPKDMATCKVIVKKGAPFTIEFYHNGDLQTIFDGNRFVMENVSNL